jgi:hypothetical protein
MRKMSVPLIGVLAVGLFVAGPLDANAQTLGKAFIRAASADGQFVDVKLEDSVKDLKKNHKNFVIVDQEADAEYLIEVVSRVEVQVSGRSSEKTVTATASFRQGDSWKPGIKVSKGTTFWALSANNVMGEIEKWAKIRSVK